MKCDVLSNVEMWWLGYMDEYLLSESFMFLIKNKLDVLTGILCI